MPSGIPLPFEERRGRRRTLVEDDAMRVALLNLDPGLPLGGPRGGSVHLRSVAAALLRAGHRVDALVAETGPAAPVAPLSDAGLQIRRLHPPVTVREIESHFAHGWPELVLERLAKMAPEGAQAAARLGVRHLYQVNSTPEEDPQLRGDTVALEASRRGFATGFSLSAGVIAVSDEVARWVRTLAPASLPIEVEPNGADPHFFATPERALVERARRELRVQPGLFHVGFVGSLDPDRGLVNLVEAVARLRRKTPAQLVFVGDGPERNALLSATLSLHVPAVFSGHVPHDLVPIYMALCDAVVVPSLRPDAPGSPISLVEAMAAGRPVVASATGPCARTLRHDRDGLLVPPGDVESLAAALERLAGDGGLRERLRLSARRTVGEGRTWDHVVARSIALAGEGARNRGGADPASPASRKATGEGARRPPPGSTSTLATPALRGARG